MGKTGVKQWLHSIVWTGNRLVAVGDSGVRLGRATTGNRYITWNELLTRTFGSEAACPECGGRLRLIALVKMEATVRTLLAAVHLPTGPPEAAVDGRTHEEERLEWGGEVGVADWVD